MALPKRLDKCPITPECTAKKLYQDDEGIYQINSHDDFIPHICKTRSSEKPEMVYLGEWYNNETERTRWIGPFRMRKSVEIEPKDDRFRKRGNPSGVWELRNVWVSLLDWSKVDD